MPLYYAKHSASGNLGTATVDQVVLYDNPSRVQVTNDTGAGIIWFTVSTTGGPNLQPSPGGNDSYSVASVAGTSSVPVRVNALGGAVINLIANAASVGYTVTAIQ